MPQPEVEGGVEKAGVVGSLGGNGVSSASWVALIYALVLVLPQFIGSVGWLLFQYWLISSSAWMSFSLVHELCAGE